MSKLLLGPQERWASPEEAEEWKVDNSTDLKCARVEMGLKTESPASKDIWFEFLLMIKVPDIIIKQ